MTAMLWLLAVAFVAAAVVCVGPLVRLLLATRHKRLAQRRLDQLRADYLARREEDMVRRRAELDVIARGDAIHSRNLR